MFIFWGTKTVLRKLGYVADFCPICRKIENFQLSRIGVASHLYGASFGKGKLVGHQKKCLSCGTAFEADATIYKDIQKTMSGATSADLTTTTFPNIRQHYSGRFALEEQLAKNPMHIAPDTRAALIKEPFQLLAPIVEKRFSATHIDRFVGLTILLTITAPLLVAHYFNILFPSAKAHAGDAILTAFAIGVVATSIQGLQSSGRYLKREIYPKIARSLRTLKPTEAEINAVCAELKRMDFKLAKKVKLKMLLQELGA